MTVGYYSWYKAKSDPSTPASLYQSKICSLFHPKISKEFLLKKYCWYQSTMIKRFLRKKYWHHWAPIFQDNTNISMHNCKPCLGICLPGFFYFHLLQFKLFCFLLMLRVHFRNTKTVVFSLVDHNLLSLAKIEKISPYIPEWI